MSLKVTKFEKIARIELDRPPVNALTLSLYEAIADMFEQAVGWNDINCIIFAANGTRAFCAGLDLTEFLAARVEDDPARARIVRRTFAAVRHVPIPVIAAVNGPALGAGAVLASVCDIRIASENATFGMPEINVGRCGGAAHMARHLPQGLLRQMVFTGRPISAEEAWRVGFVQKVVSQELLQETAQEMAASIANKSPLGLRFAKESVNAIEFMDVEPGYELEQGYSTRLMATHDAREATLAVVEKRAPNFTFS